MERLPKILMWTAITVIVVALLYCTVRVFVLDSFVVGGDSMEPALHRGQKVYVNKMLLGPRIYTNYDFSGPDLHSFRIRGVRRMRPGDIAVFNYPYSRSHDTISFKINYVYVKRCIGAPGDSVSIVDGYWRSSGCSGTVGREEWQMILSDTPDSVLAAQGVVLNASQVDSSKGWTIRNYGPLYVPRKGDCVRLTEENWRLYRKLIQHETGVGPCIMDGCICLDGKPLDGYTFRESYYFFGGDNVLNSRDSRYIGLVPEEYVIGIVAGQKKNNYMI